MSVIVMSRDAAMRYCNEYHNKPAIMISISDPYITYPCDPFCSKRNNLVAILPLFFTDADKPGKDVYDREVTENDLISEADAQQIKRLLNLHPDIDVIVHCDAGISRSSGVAAAILKASTGDDSQIFNSPKYRPNMRCYRMVLDELISED